MKNSILVNAAKLAVLLLVLGGGYLIFKGNNNGGNDQSDKRTGIEAGKNTGPIVRTAGEIVDSAGISYDDIKTFSRQYFKNNNFGKAVYKDNFTLDTNKVVLSIRVYEDLGTSYLGYLGDDNDSFLGFRTETKEDIDTLGRDTPVVLARIIDTNDSENRWIAYTIQRKYRGVDEGISPRGFVYDTVLKLREFKEGKVIWDVYTVTRASKNDRKKGLFDLFIEESGNSDGGTNPYAVPGLKVPDNYR